MTTINNKPWADQPFNLIASPRATTGLTDNITQMATDMVIVHNTFIRGLNTMVLQAEQVPALEHRNFIAYCLLWVDMLGGHHDTEEEYFFGALDKKYGQGTMQQSLDEHAAFHSGLEKLGAYLKSCAAGAEKFNGTALVDIINSFAELLVHHMSSEIVTILALDRFPEAEVSAIFESTLAEALKKLRAASLVTDLPYLFRNNDVSYEGGMHADFPPLPLPMSLLGRYGLSLWYGNLWKFASVDIKGYPKELVYAKPCEMGESSEPNN